MFQIILIALAIIVVALLIVVALQPSEFRVARRATIAAAAPAGAGGIYTWSGNKEVGEGRMTMTESRPSDLIRIKLEFFKPFAATNLAEFTFKPEGNQTVVMWSMTGEKNFVAKAIHLFMNMDKMIGGQFERGLAEIKSIVEAAAKK